MVFSGASALDGPGELLCTGHGAGRRRVRAAGRSDRHTRRLLAGSLGLVNMRPGSFSVVPGGNTPNDGDMIVQTRDLGIRKLLLRSEPASLHSHALLTRPSAPSEDVDITGSKPQLLLLCRKPYRFHSTCFAVPVRAGKLGCPDFRSPWGCQAPQFRGGFHFPQFNPLAGSICLRAGWRQFR